MGQPLISRPAVTCLPNVEVACPTLPGSAFVSRPAVTCLPDVEMACPTLQAERELWEEGFVQRAGLIITPGLAADHEVLEASPLVVLGCSPCICLQARTATALSLASSGSVTQLSRQRSSLC